MRRYSKYLIASFVLLVTLFVVLLRAQLAAPAVNRWTPAADMATARASACSVMLPDGRVMVAGGGGVSGPVSTVELYDSTGAFSTAEAMQQARANAACVALQDGRVMVAGGSDGSHSLSSVEIYDPASNKWSTAASMSQARSRLSATLLPWGAVLLAGGDNDGALMDTIEMYRPTIDQMMAIPGILGAARTEMAVAALPNHKVLLIGGTDGKNVLPNIDLFDADTTTLAAAGTLVTARARHAATALLDGRVLITGGADESGIALASTEIYDPSQGVSMFAGNMTQPRSKHMAFLLPNNNHVLIAGGVDGDRTLSSSELYTPWTPGFTATAHLAIPRQAAAASRLKHGAVIVAGGSSPSGVLSSSEVYGFASIQTDQDDYAPGSTVTITGDGWQPGEQVQLSAVATGCAQHSVEFTAAATADSRGRISISGFQVDKSHLGMRFYLTAKGSVSEAMNAFTDAVPLSLFTVSSNLNPTPWTAQPTFTITAYGKGGVGDPIGNVTLTVDSVPVVPNAVLGTVGTCVSDVTCNSVATETTSIPPGVHNVTATYGGDANYSAAPTPAANTVSQTITAPTSVAVSGISPNPAWVGQAFSLTASVKDTSGAGSTVNGGTVTFSTNGGATVLGTMGPVLGGSITLNVSAPALAASLGYTIRATYNGTSVYGISGPTPGGTPLVVNTPTTATSLSAIPPSPATPQPYGTAVTFTAVVTAAFGTPVGTVQFTDTSNGNAVLGASAYYLDGSGHASVAVSNLLPGLHNIQATFTPTTPLNFQGSVSPLQGYTIQVIFPNFNLVLNPPNPTAYQPFTVQATADPVNGAIPTGSVQLVIDGGSVPGIPLNLGTATFPAQKVSVGAHTFGINYSAALSEPIFTSIIRDPILTKTIAQTSTTTAVTSTAAPSNTAPYGTAIALTATISKSTSGTIGGHVDWYDGGSPITLCNPASISSGQAVCSAASLGTLPVGSHAFTAVYSGNLNFLTSTSSAYNLTITAATTTTSVGAAPNHISLGGSIIYTATVTASPSGAGNPPGGVVFYDDVAGTLTSINGNCAGGAPTTLTATNPAFTTCTVTYNGAGVLTGGSHSITAVYTSTNSNISGSNSNASEVTVTVDKAPTTTTLVINGSSAIAATYGQSVVLLAAKATPVSPGAGTLTGTISFYDRIVGNLLGTSGPVDSGGNASIRVPVLPGSGFELIASGSIVGGHQIYAKYNGDSNFITSSSPIPPSPNPNFVISKALTNSTVTSSVSPTSVAGQQIQLGATVLAPSSVGIVPTGTITFLDGSTTIATRPLCTGGCNPATANLLVPDTGVTALAVGSHSITVSYAGDANYAASVSTILSQTVAKAPTTTTITSSVIGQQVTLTAYVSVNPPGSGVPTGSVQFTNTTAGGGPVVLGTPALIALPLGPGGSNLYTATLTLSSMPTGNPGLTAAYSGDNSYLPSTSVVLMTQAASRSEVIVVVTSNITPSILGQQVTFTATVTPVNSWVGVPTGTLTFYDGAVQIAQMNLVGGQAIWTPVPFLTVGQHSISGSYSGDANYQPNTSNGISQVVNRIPSTLALTSSAFPAVVSQIITLTAVLSPNPVPGVPFAGGQVRFYDGSNLLGVGNLQSNVATLNVNNLSAGLHQLSAVYAGDDHWAGATSGFYAQTINRASTSTQIVSSANPSVYGQPVTFTITVNVNFPVTVPATGQVQLYDNQNALGDPVNANNGKFTITIPTFAPGTHNIIAAYTGDASLDTSSSAALLQVVNKAPTVTTLAALPSSSASKQLMTLIAVVTVPAPGAGTLTGTVQFVDTTFTKILGTAQVSVIGGVYTASITTDQMIQSGAPQILTATYSGDANFATSTSSPPGQTVFGPQVTATNGASYYVGNLAPDSWATLFGENLATSVLTAVVADGSPYPTSLAGTTVKVTDASGTDRLAPLYFVSPGQINMLIPTNTAVGLATITMTNQGGATASTIILVTRTSPGLFSANMNGQGVAAAYVRRVRADGSQSYPESVATYDSTQKAFVSVPISIGSDSIYLELYGTGIRYRPSDKSVTCTVGGANVPVPYSGPAAGFFGLDQINVGPVPSSLAGTGMVNVVCTVDGQAANTVTLTFK